MIVDASALLAILKNEPERAAFVRALASADRLRMSVVNYLEVAIKIDRQPDPVVTRRFNELVDALGLELVAVTVEHAGVAREAYRDFGKGSGHPAQLNFGDCFAYALAISAGEPLLFKGDDFTHTDVVVAEFSL
ncbi:type II toxin-antitoxin system VapC family toxin [Hoyosella sp. YIM 151337]|uniref:type II toxin-antitoxin system VapC family toxin n=1 Tax=Hoyosella sp. YIM 151337 TaxID=2992742 RepID=UPI002236A271|nr:type II toxin-antitoxin system VapC family toxin [Hoyosella sp. YIM 151337]MCW4355926.1 type II toxin-antitoxin system VapC family toxin [Hoyosella sp. YIM 151337]